GTTAISSPRGNSGSRWNYSRTEAARDRRPRGDRGGPAADGDQAYWHALEMVLGTLTARTLRSTLRLKIRGEDLSERERVAKGLAEIFSAQAATVENLARRESALRGPRPREAALQELEMHSHWVDFSDAAN